MSKEKVYIVCWASASQDDEGNSSAYGNVHGVYRKLEDAEKGLLECKDQTYDEIINDPDFDEEERKNYIESTEVYGSVKEGYFEIDYDSWDIRNEIRIEITEKEIN